MALLRKVRVWGHQCVAHILQRRIYLNPSHGSAEGWKDDVFGYTAADFARLFKQDFGYEPDYHPPQSSAAMLVFHHALQKVGVSASSQELRDAIAATDIMTFYGPVRFNEKGMNIGKGMAVIQLQNGTPKVVYPTAGSQSKFVYPIP
jgi:branched-chain amino acid transport system substrate-binding protein